MERILNKEGEVVRRLEAYGTGLRRYVLEVFRDGDDAIITIYAPHGRKTIVKLLLRSRERKQLAEMLIEE